MKVTIDAMDPRRLLPLLLAALPDDLETFRTLCATASNWDVVWERASRHGVRWLLEYYLEQACIPHAPPVEQTVQRGRAVQRLRNTRFREALDAALGAFHAAGVRAVALKGPVLAERLYPASWLRSCDDLDFLVQPADLEVAAAALSTAGYQAQGGPAGDYYRQRHHHLRLYHSHLPEIDLSFRPHSSCRMEAAPLLSRAIPAPTASRQPAWVLSPEDELLYLAVHVAGHHYARLSWLYDLKLLLRSHPGLDWPVATARARSLGISRLLSFTLERLRRELGVTLPASTGLPPSRGLRSRAASAFLASTGSDPGPRGEIAFQLLLSDHPLRDVGQRLLAAARRRWT